MIKRKYICIWMEWIILIRIVKCHLNEVRIYLKESLTHLDAKIYTLKKSLTASKRRCMMASKERFLLLSIVVPKR